MRNKYQRGKDISIVETLELASITAKRKLSFFRIDKIILTIAFCLTSLSSYPQSHSAKQSTLLGNLRNAPFSSLALLNHREHQDVIVIGEHIDQFKWEFIIPDSVTANSEDMMTLIVPQKDTVANGYRQVRFITEFKNKKNIIANIGIQDDTTYIEGDYIGKTLFENENVASNVGRTDSIIIDNLICDDFNVSVKNDSSDLTVRSIDPYYAWFDSGNNKLSYEDNLLFYIKLAEQYPDSRFLMMP